jgi:hypothetical protein
MKTEKYVIDGQRDSGGGGGEGRRTAEVHRAPCRAVCCFTQKTCAKVRRVGQGREMDVTRAWDGKGCK